MKKIIMLAAIIASTIGGGFSVTRTAYAIQCPSAATIPLYQLVKPNGKNFYTTNVDELAAVARMNYKFTGTAGRLFAQPRDGLIPVRRYYDASQGSHRYFAAQTVDASAGTFEGIMGYVGESGGALAVPMLYAANDSIADTKLYTSDAGVPDSAHSRRGTFGYVCVGGTGMAPQSTVYRMWSNKSKKHFYTTSSTEAYAALDYGYKYEGIAGYLYTQPQGNTDAVYRVYNPSSNKHFYTTDVYEKQSLIATGGYKDEGVIGYTAYVSAGVSMYRLFNAKNNDHLFTTDKGEADRAGESGYTLEKDMGYVNPFLPQY